MSCLIHKINPAEEIQITEKPNFYDLGIVSMKTAIFLNWLFAEKLDNCRGKISSCWSRSGADSKVGGGLLVKAEPEVTINGMNEVGIIFKNEWKIGSFIRVASGKSEVTRSIMDKIGNEIKKMWKMCYISEERRGVKAEENAVIRISIKEYAKTTESTYSAPAFLELDPSIKVIQHPVDGVDCITISYTEYRALYEFFKSRGKDKIISRYGQIAYDTMIGKKIEDQFLLSAIEVIRGEIKQANEQYEATRKALSEQEQKELNEIRTKYHNMVAEAQAVKDSKITELQNNMKQMREMASVATV